ncbi:hypothetical protein DXG03_006100 [Asterophora parasitica]|uniref:Chromo domain-containing protein n=1 Tax=Asterophora parasitica TaxID=117018 RepID=A0A9P7KDL2_9AGAR|nr:hypothetical protein DXG03_006100 [Asterophora parasitica]
MGKHKKKKEEEVFHVEVITKARVIEDSSDEEDEANAKKKRKKKGKAKSNWEYYVKWANYDSDSNTWEPEENVAGCQRLLASFWAEVGTDNRDYGQGYEVKASEKWIKREKKFFASEFNEAQEKLRAQREKDEELRRKREKAKKKKKSASTEFSRVVSTASSTSKSHATSLARTDDSDSEDDVPLLQRKRKNKEPESSDDDTPLTLRLPALKKAKTNDSTSLATDPKQESLFSEDTTPERPTIIAPRPLPRPLPPPPSPQRLPSSSKTTPTIPAKPLRLKDPHHKVAAATENIASGSGISTKQRLGQDALAPTKPRAPMPLPPPKPLPGKLRTGSSSNMIQLSFKKGTDPTSVMSPSGYDSKSPVTPHSALGNREPTLSALNAPASPRPRDVQTLQFAESPQDYAMREPHDVSAFRAQPLATVQRFPRPMQLPHVPPKPMQLPPVPPKPIPPPPQVQTPLNKQAEAFLSSIIPDPAIEKPFEPLPPPPLVPRRPSHYNIPKIWSWSGGVYTEDEPSKPIFNVTFFDVTRHVEGGMRFSVALSSMDRLVFPSFHDVNDLDTILRACDGVHQFARLGPQGSDDVEALGLFSTYMAKMQKTVLLPLSLDNIVVAHIAFFHHNTVIPSRYFRPPHEIKRNGSLVACLVPWSLASGQLQKHYRKPPNAYLPGKIDIEPLIKDKTRWERTVKTKAAYQHAIRILQFPQWLSDYMSEEGRERTYWVWSEGGDGTKKKPGMETLMLHAIMEQCRAKKPRSNLAETRVMFVHVGAVKTLHKFPGYLDFCSVASHVQFYTYGTHPTVPPPHWGVKEIYPCGGIVTFTPRTILEDPIRALRRIQQINSHPLWECYILPSTLGMVAKLHGQKANDDPLALFDRGTVPYVVVLNAIENGEIALITSPPTHELSPTQTDDPREDWVHKHYVYRPHGPRSILQSTVDAFNVKYGNIQQGEWMAAIQKDISKDLTNMRCQPVFMSQYRRYVAIESPNERRVSGQDGLEWTTLAKFDFKDDFFPKN